MPERNGASQYIQKRKEAAREKRDSDKHADNISALDRIKQSYIDAHKDDKSRERWKAFREGLTIALLLATAVFTGLTYYVFKDTEANELRPWLIVKGLSNFRTDPNGGFDVDVLIKNYGRSVAGNAFITGVLAPNYAGYLDKALKRRCIGTDNVRYNNGFQLPQGDNTEQMLNIYNQPVLSLGDNNVVADQATLASGEYLLLGCVSYIDQFKRLYTTKFCFRPLGPAKSGDRSAIVAVPLRACGFFDETT